MFVRVEVATRPEFGDPTANDVLRKIELLDSGLRRKIRWARVLDVYWINLNAPREQVIPILTEIFQDPVLNWLFTGDLIPSASGSRGSLDDLFKAAPFPNGKFWGLEKKFRPGVTDNVARTTKEAVDILLRNPAEETQAASGKVLILEGHALSEDDLSLISRKTFCNEPIESWTLLTQGELKSNSRFHSDQVRRQFPRIKIRGTSEVEQIQLDSLSDEQLTEMSRSRLWALNLEEMKAVQKYFSQPERLEKRRALGLETATDVELEILAQTWSEHCKHKIFAADVTYIEKTGDRGDENPGDEIPNQISSLFKQTIAGTTKEIPRPWLLSVFSDNAGIVALDDEDAICIKVETHNSPSALDPYGGALTGIVGVNRDILGCGLGAKPIFNTDVFCLARPDYLQNLPDGILHPRRILAGVRKGVEDGGNQSGIPTVNGALVFDPRYLGKPLIYCGTGGIMPRKSAGVPCETKEIQPGDRICMVGGRIGKDGIHGATFSSLALDETSPATAVQLGDPITQKRVSDFLMEARELGLYRTLTDNGAGGLSSSVGELATLCGGAKMDVAKAKTKYPGLKPYELTVSESQERMTLAVPPEKLEPLIQLARSRGVEVSDLGEFTNHGLFEVLFEEKTVAALELDFLHKGNPTLKLMAEWSGRPSKPGSIELSIENEGPRFLKDLLNRPNIASKEWLIRQYDHEVQGTSVIKPLHTSVASGISRSGPNDSSVIKPKENSFVGISVGCGLNPKYSDIDPYLMAQAAVDEAVRNTLSSGAEFGTEESVFALIDNFCWPDPVGKPEKMGWLVRACYGMRNAALALGTPFISGKDSMKNDYRGKKDGRDVTVSVPPTLLVTAMARVPDIRKTRSSDFKGDGDFIYLLGGRDFGLLGSELHHMAAERLKEKGGNERQVVLPVSKGVSHGVRAPKPNWELALKTYRWLGFADGSKQRLLRSVHDVSEGGLLAAVSESLIARNLGARIEIPENENHWEFCFGEGFHSFVVSTRETDFVALEEEWRSLGVPFLRLGRVTARPHLEMTHAPEQEVIQWAIPVEQLETAWRKEGFWE